ncbi:MAG: MerR family transcriptional regulator [Chloroflexota bacterium]
MFEVPKSRPKRMGGGLSHPTTVPPTSSGMNLDNGIGNFYTHDMAGGHRPVYVISIAAGLAGCHPRTLRIYEEEGLLEPVRTETNIRLYSDDDLRRVRVIRYLTQVRGVNLAGVKLLLHMRDASDLMEDLMRELAELGAEDDDADGAADTAEMRSKRGPDEGTRF